LLVALSVVFTNDAKRRLSLPLRSSVSTQAERARTTGREESLLKLNDDKLTAAQAGLGPKRSKQGRKVPKLVPASGVSLEGAGLRSFLSTSSGYEAMRISTGLMFGLCVAMASSVWAEDEKAAPRAGGEAQREQLIKKFDTDGDGKLNDEEKAAALKERGGRPGGKGAARRGPDGATMAELIKKYDKDGDGKLSDEEKTAAREAAGKKGGRPGAGAPGGRGGAEALKKYDKDGDGKLSEEEKTAARAGFQGKRPEGRKKPE
jgi:hypothetical protein